MEWTPPATEFGIEVPKSRVGHTQRRSPYGAYAGGGGPGKEVAGSGVVEGAREGVKQLRLKREGVLEYFAQLPPATVVMEACGSAHYWARELEKLGHRAVLLPAQHVRPYVLRDKTDRTDTRGLLEAYRNEAIRPVPIKTPTQQLLGGIHRLRSGWLAERTARINSVRGLLREQGIVIRVGARHAVPEAWAAIEDADSAIPDALRPLLAEACREIRELEGRIGACGRQLEALGKQPPTGEQLRPVPGVGLLIATALVAFVGDPRRFRSGRQFGAYLGLPPKEHSSGSKRRLGRISKRG